MEDSKHGTANYKKNNCYNLILCEIFERIKWQSIFLFCLSSITKQLPPYYTMHYPLDIRCIWFRLIKAVKIVAEPWYSRLTKFDNNSQFRSCITRNFSHFTDSNPSPTRISKMSKYCNIREYWRVRIITAYVIRNKFCVVEVICFNSVFEASLKSKILLPLLHHQDIYN